MKAIIIEDEESIRAGLNKLCSLYLPDLEIIGEAESLSTGIAIIQANTPDLIFLDINLNNENGFDILKAFPDRRFEVIFVTAHDEFALQAIKKEAVDYLLKPVDPEDLITAVQKAEKRIETHIKTGTQKLADKLIIREAEKIKAIDISTILYVEAAGAYSKIITPSEEFICSKNLRHFENILDGKQFLRVHKSFLVHMQFFQSYDKTLNALFLKTSHRIPVSTRMKENLFTYLKSVFT